METAEHSMVASAEKSKILTLVFTDLADSTALKTEHGDVAVREMIARHRAHVTQLMEECAGRVIDWAGDGCFLTFDTSSAAVMFALRLQQVHADEPDLPRVRIGVHLGEITESPGPDGTIRIEGLAVDIAARVSGLAKPGQILMSSAVYDSARQRLGVEAFGEPILWRAHGAYRLKGFDKALEISEAGVKGVAPMQAPKASEKAKRDKGRLFAGGAVAASRSLPEVTRLFRRGGVVLLGGSFVILYMGLQFEIIPEVLGLFLAALFGGATALSTSRRAFKLHRKGEDVGKYVRGLRLWRRLSLRLGLGLVALGLLLSPLVGWGTFYVLAMVGTPPCAVGLALASFMGMTARIAAASKGAGTHEDKSGS